MKYICCDCEKLIRKDNEGFEWGVVRIMCSCCESALSVRIAKKSLDSEVFMRKIKIARIKAERLEMEKRLKINKEIALANRKLQLQIIKSKKEKELQLSILRSEKIKTAKLQIVDYSKTIHQILASIRSNETRVLQAV